MHLLKPVLAAFGAIAIGVGVNAAWQSIEEPRLHLAIGAGVQSFTIRRRLGEVEITSSLRDLKTNETAITTSLSAPDTVVQAIPIGSIYYIKILLRNRGRSSVHDLRIPLFANVRGTADVSASGNVAASLEMRGSDNTIIVPALAPRSTAVLTYAFTLDTAQTLPTRVWIKAPYVASDIGITSVPDTLIRLAVAFSVERHINPSGATLARVEAPITGKRGPMLPAVMQLVPDYFAKPVASRW